MIAYTSNPSTWKAEAEGLLRFYGYSGLRKWVSDQPEQKSETLPQIHKQN